MQWVGFIVAGFRVKLWVFNMSHQLEHTTQVPILQGYLAHKKQPPP